MTPTKRQAHYGSMYRTATASSHWEIPLQNETIAHNNGLIYIDGNSGITISSITTLVGPASTWEQLMTPVVSGQSGHVWRCADLPAGVRSLLVTLSSTDQWMQFNVEEWAYLTNATIAGGALDGTPTSATGQNGSTITSGNITTGQANSLGVQFALDSSQILIGGFTAGSGWTMQGAQNFDGVAVQSQVKVSAGTLSPVITKKTTVGTYNTMAFALKADASKGDHTLANGKVKNITAQCIRTSLTSYVAQHCSEGNCVVVSYGCGLETANISGITDSPGGNTYVQQADNNDATSQMAEMWAAVNTTPNSEQLITVSWSVAAPHGVLLTYDIVGALASPIGAKGSTNSTSSSTGDLSTQSFTPQAVGSTVILAGVILRHTAINLGSNAGIWHPNMMRENVTDGSDIFWYEADLWGNVDIDAVESKQPVWQIQNNSDGPGRWVCCFLEIMSQAPAPDVTPIRVVQSGMRW